MIRCRLLLIIVAALSAAVNRPAPAQAPSNSTQSFVAVRDEWIKDWKSRNLDGLRTLYAPDAVFLPALGVGIQGRDAIGDYLKQLSDSTVGALFVVPYGPGGAGDASGDVAYDSGFMHYWIRGTIAPIKGSYLMVLKRDKNGNWQIVRQAFAGADVRYPNDKFSAQ